MTMSCRFVILFILLLTAACSFSPVISIEPQPAFDAVFEHQTGWTGADGAYTAAVPT